jgi:pantothenate kinase
MTPITIAGMDQVLDRVEQLVDRGGRERRMLGIVGAPGAGKSTISDALLASLPAQTALLPMDGFHLANEALDRLGRRDRKGAPDTFDALGFTATLERIRRREAVYAPRFDRDLDAGVAGAILLAPEVPLIVTEGNYLLLNYDKWKRVRIVLDEAWFLFIDDDLRVQRLIDRHLRFGRTLAEAEERVLHGTDHVNALMVNSSKAGADLLITDVV